MSDEKALFLAWLITVVTFGLVLLINQFYKNKKK